MITCICFIFGFGSVSTITSWMHTSHCRLSVIAQSLYAWHRRTLWRVFLWLSCGLLRSGVAMGPDTYTRKPWRHQEVESMPNVRTHSQKRHDIFLFSKPLAIQTRKGGLLNPIDWPVKGAFPHFSLFSLSCFHLHAYYVLLESSTL